MTLTELDTSTPDSISRVPASTEVVRSAVETEGVVALEDKAMDPGAFVEFLQTLGPLMFTLGERPVPAHPDLNIVTNVGRARKPRSVFHSDTTYVSQPPSYAGLIAVDVPASGGATLFIDQYAAYAALPTALKSLLRGATVVHTVTGVDLPSGAERTATHPVVRHHPGTGKPALYLTTPARCSNLTLSSGEDRSDLIEWLYNHCLTNGPRKSHRWQPGDVVIWDNRCTLHAADHSAVVGDRTLYRGLVRGEVPLPSSA